MTTMIGRTVALALGVGFLAQISLGAKQEIVVTNAAGDQQMPAVWQSIIVWEGVQSNNWDIFFKDAADPQGTIRRLSTAALGEDRNPSIWGSTVVWQKKSSAAKSWDIYAADISDAASPMPFPVSLQSFDEQRPRIWNTSLVFEFFYEGDWCISFVDLSDPGAPTELWWQGQTQVDFQYPAVCADLVVCQYKDAGSSEILAFGREDPNRYGWVAAEDNDQSRPVIWGNWVVWQDDYNGDWDIRGTENSILAAWSPLVICERSGSNATCPAIWNNVVVWQDDRNGNWDIYGYNLTTKKEFQITDNNKDQTNPAISFSPSLNKYVVVWQDNRNGNSDIYAALIDGAEVAGCASPSKWDVNADAVVDAKDVGDVQQHTGERNGITP